MRKRPAFRGWWLHLVGFAALIVVLVWTQTSVRGLGDELKQSRADNAALAEQVKELGGTPTVAPPPIEGVTGDDVRAIVTDELTKHKVTLTPAEVSQIARVAAGMVPKPKDGVTPSAAQVRGIVSATFQAFCAQPSKPCEGKEGPKGKDAPPITEAQLSAVVGAFCGEDAENCRGLRGEVGPAGRGIKSITKSGETVTVTYTDGTTDTFTVPDGKDGRGIASGPTCTGSGKDSYWLTVYTDGTEQKQDGPCRIDVVPPIVEPK
jgi:hypothetical protein